MRHFLREVLAAARLDVAEIRRSRWLLFAAAVYAVLGVGFVFVGLRESTVLGFTGMGRALFSAAHALLVVLPLLALSATVQVVNSARDNGMLELLFTLPLRRTAFYVAVSLARFTALFVPLVVVLVGGAILGRIAFGEVTSVVLVLRAIAVGGALLFSFVGIGVAASTWIRSQARALVTLLLLWALAVALLDFGLVGLMLQWRVPARAVFVIAALNPVQASRLALLSGIEPELSVLGPVGFYLSTRLGDELLLFVGLAWPLALGAFAWLLGLMSFRKGDVV